MKYLEDSLTFASPLFTHFVETLLFTSLSLYNKKTKKPTLIPSQNSSRDETKPASSPGLLLGNGHWPAGHCLLVCIGTNHTLVCQQVLLFLLVVTVINQLLLQNTAPLQLVGNLQTLCSPNVNQLLAGLSGWSGGYCLPVPYLHWNSKFHSQKPLPFGPVCLRNKLIAAVKHHPCCDSHTAHLYCLGWRSEPQLPAGLHPCTLELLLPSSCWALTVTAVHVRPEQLKDALKWALLYLIQLICTEWLQNVSELEKM